MDHERLGTLLDSREFQADMRLACSLSKPAVEDLARFVEAHPDGTASRDEGEQLSRATGKAASDLRDALSALTALLDSPEFQADRVAALASVQARLGLSDHEREHLSQLTATLDPVHEVASNAMARVTKRQRAESFLASQLPRLTGFQGRVVLAVDPASIETDAINVMPILELEFITVEQGEEALLRTVQADATTLAALSRDLGELNRTLSTLRKRMQQGVRTIPVEE